MVGQPKAVFGRTTLAVLRPTPEALPAPPILREALRHYACPVKYGEVLIAFSALLLNKRWF